MCPWSHRRSVAHRRVRTEVSAPSACRARSPVHFRSPDAPLPALPTLLHPHLEAQYSRKKLKRKKYATFYIIACLGFFFKCRPFFVCACAHFVFQLYPKYPRLCSRLISVFWGLFSFDKMLLAVLYLLLYILPPLIYSYLYRMERIKQFWFFFPMIPRNAIFITGYSQRRRKENLRVFPSAVFLSRHGGCPSPPLFCSVCQLCSLQGVMQQDW